MVPRWRSSQSARVLGETSALLVPRIDDASEHHDPLTELKRDWEQRRGFAHANDLISAAITLRRKEEAAEAARFVLEHSQRASDSAKRLASNTLGLTGAPGAEVDLLHEEQAAADVARLRSMLRLWPVNAIGWADLARSHAILGAQVKAERAIRMALGLAPDHRFTLRAATRFFQTFDEPDRALSMLRGRAVTREDPWLMSAEIAMSRILDRSPRFVRRARELLLNGGLDPFHTSELAASLATLDFESGRDRDARRKFGLALRSPTENAVAQASWAQRHHLDLGLSDDLVFRPSAHEAQAWQALLAGQWDLAYRAALGWLADEPFSSQPARFGGYLAAVVLKRYDEAVRLSRVALRAKPDHFGLLNNLAFSYASDDEPEQAAAHLARVKEEGLNTRERIVLTGTRGLVEYRRGDIGNGRDLYGRAVLEAKRLNDDALLVSALTFFAREESRVSGNLSAELLNEAVRVQERAKEKTLQPVLDDLMARSGGA